MDSAGYVSLGRQSGLMHEMQIVANNIANLSTTGFRREAMVFAEYISPADQGPSLSMAHGTGRLVDLSQAGLSATGAAFDLAIDGEGFFRLSGPEGERLSRAGNFTPTPEGELLTPEGFALLDAGGTPVQIPPGATIAVGPDGTISSGGEAIGQIGLWRPVDPLVLRHQSGTTFDGGETEPATGGLIRQGFLEDSNVNPIREVARMIEVQRAYELGQKFLDAEDDRTRKTIQTLGA